MASKRQGCPLVKREAKRMFVKPEPRGDSKPNLSSIPPVPKMSIKRESADCKPDKKCLDKKLQLHLATASTRANRKRSQQSRRHHGPPCISVDIRNGVAVKAHYDRMKSEVRVKLPDGVCIDTAESCSKIISRLKDCFIFVQLSPNYSMPMEIKCTSSTPSAFNWTFPVVTETENDPLNTSSTSSTRLLKSE